MLRIGIAIFKHNKSAERKIVLMLLSIAPLIVAHRYDRHLFSFSFTCGASCLGIGGRCYQDASTFKSCVGGHCEGACAQFDTAAPGSFSSPGTVSNDSDIKEVQKTDLTLFLLRVAGFAFITGATTLGFCLWCWKRWAVGVCVGGKYSLLGRANGPGRKSGQIEMEDWGVR